MSGLASTYYTVKPFEMDSKVFFFKIISEMLVFRHYQIRFDFCIFKQFCFLFQFLSVKVFLNLVDEMSFETLLY